MYLVQTFKIVWLGVVIELISSNCNPTATCAGQFMSRACQLITHLQLFTREDTVTKEMLVID